MSISEHKHMPEAARRIEVFTGAGRRRNWSAEEKAAIVTESYAGETVCAVARRHGLTPQQLFTWRRLARGTRTVEAPVFVPAVADMPAPAVQGSRRQRLSATASIELEIDSVIVRIGPGAQASTVATVIRALKARS